MYYIKPKVIFDRYPIYVSDKNNLDRLNMKKLVDNLYFDSNYTANTSLALYPCNRYGKINYDNLPREFKYNFSQRQFETNGFKYEEGYSYGKDMNLIYLDYCEEFFRRWDSKAVRKFFNKILKENPHLALVR